ncbi:three prime repair exonuclease 2-like [Erpetoichthys calabaricus]|nr:three prime repair exonuclease 2-like [Erpetoichthys calabaricus]XP_051789485.1 three prime repair exonuclease 2-like [Erpetoichthys calabaricus]
MSKMQHFQTFVFLDLETTGICGDRPRLTEMCLASVHRFSLENSTQSIGNRGKAGHVYPRVMDKLCLCVNPNKLVSQKAFDLSGLSNENLTENCKSGFDQTTVTLLRSFLERQAPPVCLVAHNGFKFDFPLLRTELTRQEADLPDNVFCADSYQALRQILEGIENPRFQRIKGGYSLSELYKRFHGVYPLNAHCAEADVLTLISVFLSHVTELLNWADLYAKPWKEITPMYKPSPSKNLHQSQLERYPSKQRSKAIRSSQSLGLV